MYSTCFIWFCILMHVSVRTAVCTSAGGTCQSTINKKNDVCYWLETNEAQFTDAQQSCSDNGGNLATVDSAETAQFLTDFMQDMGIPPSGTTAIWIGYKEGNLAWNDGTPFSWTDYYPGEPDQTYEECTAIVMSHLKWVDYYCLNTCQFICQREAPLNRQFEFSGVDQGSDVSVGDHVVVVQTDSVISCAIECAHDVYCSVFRYIQGDGSCTMYNPGSIRKTADIPNEWFLS